MIEIVVASSIGLMVMVGLIAGVRMAGGAAKARTRIDALGGAERLAARIDEDLDRLVRSAGAEVIVTSPTEARFEILRDGQRQAIVYGFGYGSGVTRNGRSVGGESVVGMQWEQTRLNDEVRLQVKMGIEWGPRDKQKRTTRTVCHFYRES